VIDKNELCNQVVLTFRIKRSTTLHITLSVPTISIRRQFTIFAKGKPLDFPPKLMPLSAPAPSCLRIWTPRTPWNPGKTKAGNGINTRRGIERRSTSWSTRASDSRKELAITPPAAAYGVLSPGNGGHNEWSSGQQVTARLRPVLPGDSGGDTGWTPRIH
jgi:hypothetical protein